MSNLLSEAAYAVVLQCSNLRGRVSSTILGFARDRLIVTVKLIYWPCPRYTPPGDCFRTEKVGPWLLERTKAFSLYGSRKKMVTRYGIILQSLTHSSAVLMVMFAV